MNAEERYLEHLRTIERIAASVARRNHVRDSEAEEFVQQVRVWLLEDDYAIIRKFEGRASFSTYLTTVIARLFTRWRIEQWGKWRPSAEAKRLGEAAIMLERLLTRDGYTLSEAVRTMTTPGGCAYTSRDLEALYLRLPQRNPRPVVIAGDDVPDVIAVPSNQGDGIEAEERAQAAEHAARVLDEVIGRLDAEDHLILEMRFWHARRVPDIARTLHLDQKKLYKRLDRLFDGLRRELERAGVSQDEVMWLLATGGEFPPSGSSNGTGGDDAR